MHADDATPEAHPVYDRHDAERVLFGEAPEIARPDTSWFAAAMAGDTSVRPGWSANRAENHVMLVQLRYADRRAAAGDQDGPHWASVADRLRNDVAAANLALVLAIVSRCSPPQTRRRGDFDDRVSHATAALCRAVEKFDPFRGFAFSTYASVAMRKALAQRAARAKRMPLCPGDEAMRIGDAVQSYAKYHASEREDDHVERLRVAVAAAELTPDEQHVLTLRMAERTYEEIGRGLGRTKERTRQLHLDALAKVRAAYLGESPQAAALWMQQKAPRERTPGKWAPPRPHRKHPLPDVPIEPRAGSRPAALLAMLRAGGELTLDAIAERLGTDKRHARVYIDYLVKTGWPVVNVGLRTYAMRT